MTLDPREGLFEFTEFRGLRNTVDPSDFEPGDMATALNVDVNDGNVTRRKGYGTVVVAGVDRDLFASGSNCLGVGSNVLKQIMPDYSTIVLRSSMTPNRALSYCAISDRVYYTSGIEFGVVQNGANRTWGMVPPVLGAVTLTGGGLLAGRYQLTLTYVRSDGQESGARLSQVVTVPAGGGFTAALPVSTDPTVTYKRVYLTARDGQALYEYATVPNADTSISIQLAQPGTIPLETQFLVPPEMLGTISHIAYGNGHMLVAADNRLFVSEPYAPELFDPRKAYAFPDRVTMIAFLEDGAWLGTDTQIAWLASSDIEKWEFKQRANYGVIPGTAKVHSAEAIAGGESKLPAVFFAANEGLCAGMANGELLNFTKARFAYPIQPLGAGVVRDYRGGVQWLVSLNGPETPGNVAS